MAGIVDVNAHVIPRQESLFIGIYDKGSMIEHSCLPNCSKSFAEDGKLVIRSAREILEGEHLSISYTEVLWGRQARQDYLLRTKYFVCECVRCSDPTELATYFNSFKCTIQGCSGYMVPVNSSLPAEYHWQCVECHRYRSEGDFPDLTAAMNEGASNLNQTNPESCKEFLMKHKKYLHPNHYLMVMAELELLKSFNPLKFLRASNEDLDYLIKINKHVLDLTSKLAPAEESSRGSLIVVLHSLMSELWRRKRLSGEIDDEQLQQNLQMSKDLLEEAYSLLKNEPEDLEAAKMTLKTLNNIRLLDKIMGGAR